MTNYQSKIEKLIAELCPNGVEFKELGEVLKRTKGTPITAGQMSELNKEGAPIKIFAGGRTVAYVDYGDIPDKDVLTKESVVVKSRGIIAFEYIDKPFSHKNEFWSYHSNNPDINIKYIYYYLKNKESYFQTVGQKMSKMPQLSIPDTDNFKIPLPPLAIQQEIVKILDTFTQLEAELEAQLEARNKQYEYYRSKLLLFSEGTRQTTLGEVFTMKAGHHISALNISDAPTEDHPFPCYGGNGVRGFVVSNSHDGEYLLIGRQGALCGNVQRFKGKFYATEHAVVVTPSSDIDVDWAFHMLTLMNLNQYASKSAQPGLAVGRLDKAQISLPSLAEQKRIGILLDKFDALVNDISIGLPAELNARRKQYEYYREKLLTFTEL